MRVEIARVPAFNRTATRRLGVLNEQSLGCDRSLLESRPLFEIGVLATPVRNLRALERQGLVRTAPAGDPGRVRVVRLSRSGIAELRRPDRLSDELARSMLAPLREDQARRLVLAMTEVDGVGRRILEALEQVARARGLGTLRLGECPVGSEALRLYRASGYREVPRYDDNPYAQHWFEKVLSRGEG